MGKYLSVINISFKQEKDTILNILFRSISFFVMIYIFVQLWSYIYGENGTNELINGYSLGQMIWFLITTELLFFCSSNKQIVRSVATDIQSGGIAYKLNKPYNYFMYQLCNFSAKSTFVLCFYIPIALIMGFAFVGVLPTFTWLQIIPCLLVVLLSTIMSWALCAIIGLISFWIQDSTPFHWIVSKLIMLLGLFFPVQFFPVWLQPIIMYSPIYSIMSGPADLVVNFSWSLFGKVALSQLFWLFVLVGIGLLIYTAGKKKVVSNGG